MKPNLILYFSLPFIPVGGKNLYFTGHLALDVNGTVYQVFNPKALKASFLFSVMPTSDWLHGEGGFWVDRDRNSPSFRHVYLYRHCETRRTVVYSAGLLVHSSVTAAIVQKFHSFEDQFLQGNFGFSLSKNNCSSTISAALDSSGLIRSQASDLIPVRYFRRFCRVLGREHSLVLSKTSHYNRREFVLHRFCIGLGFDPEKVLDKQLKIRPLADEAPQGAPS